MSFQAHDLSALAYSNGFTLWHYRSTDALSDIDNLGYFNTASSMLRPGDFIMVNAGVGTVPEHGFLAVVANTSGTVDTANPLAFAASNTD